MIESIRQKLAEYEAQLKKIDDGARRPVAMIDVSHPEIRGRRPARARGGYRRGRCHLGGLRARRIAWPADDFMARESQVVAGIELLPLIYELRGGVDAAAICEKASGDCAAAGEVIAPVSGTRADAARMRARGAEFSAAAGRRRHSRGALRRSGRGNGLPRARYAQDHARLAAAGEDGGSGGRRDQSSHGPVRRDPDQEQSHRRGGRRAPGASRRARAAKLPIEIEVRTRAELEEALAAGAKHLLLDNLTPAEAAEQIR